MASTPDYPPGVNASSPPADDALRGAALLGPLDPPPVLRVEGGARSRFLLVADHAGTAIPAALGDLGLPEHERLRHIGWDIGVMEMGRRLAALMGAVFLAQRYSRLVIDCNRAPDDPRAVPETSDGTRIPGNAGLSAAARAARAAAIHAPYQAAVAAELDAMGAGAVLVALHSFTPEMGGRARPWHCGVLHMGHGFALRVRAGLAADAALIVGDNEPYRMEGIDYTVPHHAFARGLDYAEIEVRQDLIAGEPGQAAWAERLARVLGAA